MNIDVPAFAQDFDANGGATGSIQVASSAGFYVGTIAYLSRNSNPGARCVIVSIPDSTHVVARIVADDNEQQQAQQIYGAGSNLSAWTTALSARISMPAQLAKIEPQSVKPAGMNV